MLRTYASNVKCDCRICDFNNRNKTPLWCEGWNIEVPYVKICEKFRTRDDKQEQLRKKSLRKYTEIIND